MPPALAGLIGAVTVLAVVALVVVVRRGVEARRALNAPRAGSESTNDLTKIVLALHPGAALVGSHDEVLVSNEAAAALGIVRGTRIGFRELLELVRRARADQTIFRGHVDREREPGTYPTELTARIIPLDDGRLLVIAEDEAASRRVDAVRRDFVANVSHELKTPIGAIGILSEAIELAADEPEQVKDFAARLQRESARLGELVTQIIDLSRLQSADHLGSRAVVDISDVVDEALSRHQASALKRGITIARTEVPDARVLGDKWQLADAVSNLVQNAIAYSGERARVAVSVARVTEDGDEFVDIKVADNGIGIAPEDQDRVFERFFRVDYGRSRESGGTGLGLSIVRHIALAHGGSIRLWSRPRQGSTFTLRLPAHVGPDPTEPDDDQQEDPAP